MQAIPPIIEKENLVAKFDCYGDEFDYKDFCAEINVLVKPMNTIEYFAYGTALTWRNVAGFNNFTSKSGSDIINQISPKTNELTIEVYRVNDENERLKFIIYHHDKPMGETIWLMSQKNPIVSKVMERYFT